MQLKLGSRKSPLALWQADHVADRLRREAPGLEVTIRTITTSAERFPDVPPAQIGVGIFTREIDEELLSGEIDFAVHSLKDVASEIHARLTIAAVPERESPLDAFIGSDGAEGPALWDLPPGASVGTGSPRRIAQILRRRPDLRAVPLRGNVDTRLRKAREGGLAGTILAHAGLRRLGREGIIRHLIPAEWMVPAVAQGALGIMTRADRKDVIEIVRRLEHRESRLRVSAERAFLATLRGGCQLPAGALAELSMGGGGGRGGGGDKSGATEILTLRGVIASPDGARLVEGSRSGAASDGEEIGRALARELLARGGREILAAARPSATA